ncbi:MAG: hypothetical protein ABEJ79_12575 [Halolamina sp.]
MANLLAKALKEDDGDEATIQKLAAAGAETGAVVGARAGPVGAGIGAGFGGATGFILGVGAARATPDVLTDGGTDRQDDEAPEPVEIGVSEPSDEG